LVHISTRTWKPALLAVLLSVVYLVWARAWWSAAQTSFDVWQTGDWLINYSGGFVRRGMYGTILILLAPSSWSLITIVTLGQLLLVGSLFVTMFLLYLRTDRSWAWAMLLLSPAVLAFPILNIAGGARKEILVIVALALTALGLSASRWRLGLWLSLPIFVIAVFSHEPAVLTLPAFLFLLWTSPKLQGFARWVVTVLFVGVAILAAGASARFSGSKEVTQAICRSWSDRQIYDCHSGALDALQMPLSTATSELRDHLFPNYWNFIAVFALALLPLFVCRFLPRHWLITSVIVVGGLPLFITAWDYGRWIYLIIAQLSILALSTAAKGKNAAPMNLTLLGMLGYFLLWGFNYYGDPIWKDGLLISWLKSNFPHPFG
jgi:hypothetical protein